MGSIPFLDSIVLVRNLRLEFRQPEQEDDLIIQSVKHLRSILLLLECELGEVDFDCADLGVIF